MVQSIKTHHTVDLSGFGSEELVDSLPDLVCVVHADNTLAYANKAGAAYFGVRTNGYSRRQDWQSFIHTDDRVAALALRSKAVSSGAAQEADVRLRCTDGVYRWHFVRFVPLTADDAQGDWLVSAIDIDDRHRAEDMRRFFSETIQLLSESLNYRDTLRRLVQRLVPTWADICAIDILEDDREMRRIEVASTSQDRRRQLDGLRIREWASAPGSSETIGDVIARGQSVFLPRIDRLPLEQMAPSATELAQVTNLRPRSGIFVPLRARNRTFGALTLTTVESKRVYTLEDLAMAEAIGRRAGVALENARLYAVTRRSAEQLKAANRAKDEFLGLMSHELRTPITTIYGNARILHRLMDSLDRDALIGAISDVKNDAERLHLIIENLLALSRTEMVSRSRIEPVLVRNAVERQVAHHRNSYPEREIRIDLHDPQVCVNAADPAQPPEQRREIQPARHADHHRGRAGGGRGVHPRARPGSRHRCRGGRGDLPALLPLADDP